MKMKDKRKKEQQYFYINKLKKVVFYLFGDKIIMNL